MISWIYVDNIFNILQENNCRENDLSSQVQLQQILTTF